MRARTAYLSVGRGDVGKSVLLPVSQNEEKRNRRSEADSQNSSTGADYSLVKSPLIRMTARVTFSQCENGTASSANT